jgi:hypothetical protein
MRSESRIFTLLTAFLVLMAIIYGLWTRATTQGTEWVGVVALVLSGVLTGMCGQYFALVARRIEPRPEDRSDAEISDGAGDMGFFSPGSYWPFGLAVSAAIAGLGLAYWFPWLIALGMFAVLGSVGGLLYEYYARTSSH